jgi:hypothetical protein
VVAELEKDGDPVFPGQGDSGRGLGIRSWHAVRRLVTDEDDVADFFDGAKLKKKKKKVVFVFVAILHFFNFQASLNHRRNACSCFSST